MRFSAPAVALALALPLLGAAAPAPVPAAVGTTVQKIVTATGVPGLQVLIVDHGKVAYSAAYGVRNLKSKAPVDEHTRFEIGSITKQFTAAAILQLKEQGKLSLSDPLGKYVPQLKAAKNVTIEQLLWQVSGIPDYTETDAFKQLIVANAAGVTIPKSGTFDAIVALIADKPLNFTPGSKWAYSNTNYVLLGHVVEAASGMPWQQYIRTHIFAPAGMHESAFMEDEPHLKDMATGYTMQKGKLLPTGTFTGWARGAGAIVSTASDMAKWDAALFGGKIVSASDLKLMTTAGPVPAGGLGNYGFGWVVDAFDGQPRLWHNGGTLGFLSENQVYPSLSQTVIVLQSSTASDPSAIAEAAFDAMHPAFAAAKLQPAAGEDAAITARCKLVWQELLSGNVDHSQFNDRMNKVLTPEALAEGTASLKKLGTPTTWTYAGKEVHDAMTVYRYHLAFASGVSLNLVMAVGQDGKIAGFGAH